jgi:hypothetical protein
MIQIIKNIAKKSLIWSLKTVRKENIDFINKLEKILPSLKDQENFNNDDNKEDSEYIQLKRRNLHAFQLQFTLDKINEYKVNSNTDKLSVVDIGDSSGNHLIQLRELDPDICDIASVNLDIKAIHKIRNKGIKAYHCRAEDLLKNHNLRPNFFISYQMLEHLTDPVRFLHSISESNKGGVTSCDRFIISVPYQKQSRVGFWHMRFPDTKTMRNAEDVHIFELSPKDWKLLAEFSGWEVVSDKIYYQYPKWHWLYFTKYLWKKFDFEGFYIMELKINNKWSKLYESW